MKEPGRGSFGRLQFVAALRSTTVMCDSIDLAFRAFGRSNVDGAFGSSAAITARFRFVHQDELRAALLQFCEDLQIRDDASVEALSANRIHYSTLERFRALRPLYAPHPAADLTGRAAADFMAAEALTLLLGFDSAVAAQEFDIPLMEAVLRRGAEGLFSVGRQQFEALAQMAVDLVEWLVLSNFKSVVLVESPLGNSVPVAIIRSLALERGIPTEIVEWGCPRNDRASNGRTVADSARDLASNSTVEQAQFILFVDDAITGSRFLKMARALRREIGESRFGAVAMRFRYPPEAGLAAGQIRDLGVVRGWAEARAMPFGEVVFPDLPLFNIDEKGKVFLETALTWGDASLVAGKRKNNLVFVFLDRFEAIAERLGAVGPRVQTHKPDSQRD